MQTYRNGFDANTQISAEERIAAAIFGKLETAGCENGGTLTEQDCSDLGRAILKQVLGEFRSDLFTDDLQSDFRTGNWIPHRKLDSAHQDGCPYCGSTKLRTLEDHDSYQCNDCDAQFGKESQ